MIFPPVKPSVQRLRVDLMIGVDPALPKCLMTLVLLLRRSVESRGKVAMICGALCPAKLVGTVKGNLVSARLRFPLNRKLSMLLIVCDV